MKKLLLLAAFICPLFLHSQTLTQSVSQEIIDGNSVACVNFTIGIRDNNYFRAFSLEDTDFGSYDVTGIEFGVEQLTTEIPEGFPVTVRLYVSSEGFPANYPDGYELVAEEVVPLFSETLTMHTVPMEAGFVLGEQLIVEISIPLTDGSFFQLGSNNFGQTAPTFISSETCELDAVDMAAIGFGDMHAVINVLGSGNLAINQHTSGAFGVYPNPTWGKVNIDLEPNIQLISAAISDISGKEVLMKTEGNTVDLSSFASGIYFLKVNTSEGIFCRKIVKN